MRVLDDEPARHAHVQRCTYTEFRGTKHWQCISADPHPGKSHQLPIDARYGRDLHTLDAEKLAALLRDQVALTDNATRKVDDLQAVGLDLLQHIAEGTPLAPRTREWAQNVAPAAALLLGWIP